ncbi:hypothetical protein [Nocardioides sp. SYSU D00038]|uniref:hypothetical protein n=1 Tax=Nocardioides sp. SYSU D00038 TaxID=2812554 RepID=UPI0019680E6B|nr:hypothetical protein [Nocardioides sp. SYSU D00038]
MSAEELREQLARIGDRAPVADVPPDTWARGRRSLRRARLATAGAVVAAVTVVAGLVAWLPARDAEPPVADRSSLGVPDRIELPPERMSDRSSDDSWTREEVSDDLAVGVGAAAFVTPFGLPVVVDAADGSHHLLDLPDFAGNASLVAHGLFSDRLALELSPDGTRLAYAYAEIGPESDSAPIPSGVRVVDLGDGSVRTIPVVGGEGVVVTDVGWSPSGSWLVWRGAQLSSWTSGSMGGVERDVAGRVAPGAVASDRIRLPSGNASVTAAIDDRGTVVLSGDAAVRLVFPESPPVGVTETDDVIVREPSFSVHVAWRGPVVHDVRLTDDAQEHVVASHVTSPGFDQPMEAARRPFPFPQETSGRPLAVLGWVDDEHLLVRVGQEGEPAVGSLGELAVVGPGGPDLPGTYRVVGELDEGLPRLSVATDLVTVDHPTVERPAPDWPWSEERISLTIGLGVAGALSVLWLLRRGWRVWLARRRPAL